MVSPPERRHEILDLLYGPAAPETASHLERLLDEHRSGREAGDLWDEHDAWVITYPDQFRRPGEPTLQTLHTFFDDRLSLWMNGMHVLPFYPWSSDDGFAVIDPTTVDPVYGTWSDIEALAERHRLALDAVVNHLSAESIWFRRYLSGDPAYEDYFLTADPNTDLTSVVRPRTTPLLTRFASATGQRWVWTTFSTDQVDLNYHNPNVLLEMIRVLLGYAAHGASVIRLDAIALVWKELGTSCMSLPQTHAFVELIRSCLDATYPGTLVLTETNVPHDENISYFGSAERPEAHIVYQFPLAPLVLHTFATGDTTTLTTWAASLDTRPGTTFLNFLASHDGVGVRPVEGLLTRNQIGALCDLSVASGGAVGERTLSDGATSPYELNATWFDLLAVGHDEEEAIARHLASHAIMFALRGIPAVYVHSLFGTDNDARAYERTGLRRSLNRHRFDDADALERRLQDGATRAHRILCGLRRMLEWRRRHAAFAPDAQQRVLDAPRGLVAIERRATDTAARVLVNTTPTPIDVRHLTRSWRQLTGDRPAPVLGGWQSLWLTEI
ncbi:sucrose phosphorylase [bacterium BMS3Abin02]|nr:sucrose phosphorylase [bacterium BMS3Abin02]